MRGLGKDSPTAKTLLCRLFGCTSTWHGYFHGTWPDPVCRRCGRKQ